MVLKNLTGNNKYLKKLNQSNLMDLIRIHKKISRTQISKYTGLSATAVGLIISELIKQKKIIETGSAQSTGGRKQVFLELNPHYRYSFGIDFDVNGITIILIDISSTIIHEEIVVYPAEKTISDILQEINSKINEILNKYSIKRNKVLGIGFSLPGLIDMHNRHIVITPNLSWNDTDIIQLWNSISDISVVIINEAKSSAVSEHWIGSCQQINNFICINIKSGIGSGVFINGMLYHGHSNYAGEVGHIVVDENGPLCGCGNHGCLETFSSVNSIVERYKELLSQPGCHHQHENMDKITLSDIIYEANNSNELAHRVLLDSARYLARAISSIVKALNPEVVVIGKEFVKYSNLVMDYIKEIVYKKSIQYPSYKLKIITSSLGEKSSALGAAIIPIQHIFGKSSFSSGQQIWRD